VDDLENKHRTCITPSRHRRRRAPDVDDVDDAEADGDERGKKMALAIL